MGVLDGLIKDVINVLKPISALVGTLLPKSPIKTLLDDTIKLVNDSVITTLAEIRVLLNKVLDNLKSILDQLAKVPLLQRLLVAPIVALLKTAIQAIENILNNLLPDTEEGTFFTQVNNFVDGQLSSVNRRTGLFSVSIPLVSIAGNYGQGPNFDLILDYHPENSENFFSLGTGFEPRLSYYDVENHLLVLSSGERYKVKIDKTSGQPIVQQKKLESFRFVKTEEGIPKKEVYKVIWKNGQVEILGNQSSNNRLMVTTQIYTATGKFLNVDWSWGAEGKDKLPKLTKISDPQVTFFEAEYTETSLVTFTIFPSKLDGSLNESYDIKLLFSNAYLEQIVIENVNGESSAPNVWLFNYTSEPETSSYSPKYYLITSVFYPSGLAESVEYDFRKMLFPAQVKSLSPMPAVTKYISDPGSEQSTLEVAYDYSKENYLGYGASASSWSSETDYLYANTNYTYWSKETYSVGAIRTETQRSYNQFHLLENEIVTESNIDDSTSTSTITTTKFYADNNQPFDKQILRQFQCPSDQSTTYRDNKTDESRTEETSTNFDQYGNLTYQRDSDGTAAIIVYYPATGEGTDCPADPWEFTRYIKEKSIIPPTTQFITKPKKIKYFYTAVNNNDKKPIDTAVVLSKIEYYDDATKIVTETLSYYIQEVPKPLNGVLKIYTNTYHATQQDGTQKDYSQQKEIIYKLNVKDDPNFELMVYQNQFFKLMADADLVFSVNESITTFDNLNMTSSKQYISKLSGRVLYDVDELGNITAFVYDKLGRPLTQIDNKKTEYEDTARQQYDHTIDEQKRTHSVNVTEVDSFGNKTKTYFDGMGNKTNIYFSKKLESFDQDSDTEQLVASYEYDALGREISQRSYDYWKENEDDKIGSIGAETSYFNWDGVRRQFNDDTEERITINPITLVNEATRGIAGDTFQPRSRIVTQLDINSNPISIKRYLSDSTTAYSEIKRAYDGWDRLCEEVDEMGNKITYEYDAFDREIKRVLPDDEKSSLEKRYAPYTEDALLIGSSITASEQETVSLGTQECDGLLRVKKREAGGRTETFAYDGVNPKPAGIKYTDDSFVLFSNIPQLDNATNLVRAAKTGNALIQQAFTYNKKTGLIEGTENNDQWKCQFNYEPSGALISEASKDSGTIWKKPNPAQEQDGALSKSNEFSWSLFGKKIHFMDVAGQTTSYSYDDLGRLVKINENYKDAERVETKHLEVSFSYDIQNNTMTQINRYEVDGAMVDKVLEIVVSYDDFNREQERTINSYESQADYEAEEASYTATVSQHYYVTDQLMYREVTLNGTMIRREDYTYDKRNRLIKYSCIGDQLPNDNYGKAISEQTFKYDPLNNMTQCVTKFGNKQDTATFLYENAKDPMQLSKIQHSHTDYPSEITLEYDANGRMTKNEQGYTLSYDALGRLMRVVNEKENVDSKYHYDTLNRLFKCVYKQKQQKETISRVVYYHNNSVVNEYIIGIPEGGLTDANPQADISAYRYVKQDNTGIAEMKVTVDGRVEYDNEENVVDYPEYLLTDAEDTTLTILKSGYDDRNHDKSLRYTPWGWTSDPDKLSDKPLFEPAYPLFKGEQFDLVMGCYYLGDGYRPYSPGLMRFTCPDSLSVLDGGDINPYAYCAGDPINRTDPSGHLSTWAWAGIALGVVGLVASGVGLVALFTGGGSVGLTGLSLLAAGISGALGIAASALEDADPYASEILGWISFGFGVVTFGYGVVTFGYGVYNVGSWVAKSGPLKLIEAIRNFSFKGPSNIIPFLSENKVGIAAFLSGSGSRSSAEASTGYYGPIHLGSGLRERRDAYKRTRHLNVVVQTLSNNYRESINPFVRSFESNFIK